MSKRRLIGRCILHKSSGVRCFLLAYTNAGKKCTNTTGTLFVSLLAIGHYTLRSYKYLNKENNKSEVVVRF